MNSANDGEEVLVTIGLMKPINLIDKIERRKVLRRLNTINAFDFDYSPSENDQLELNYEEDYGYKFTFKKGKEKLKSINLPSTSSKSIWTVRK